MNHNFFNLSKRKKRDILHELLIGASREGIISKKELNALNKLINGLSYGWSPAKADMRAAGTKMVSPVKSKVQDRKKKTTHYLSQDVSEKLEKASLAIRSQVPEDLQPLISKSFIVDQALAIILQEFETKGNKSRLMGFITQNT